MRKLLLVISGILINLLFLVFNSANILANSEQNVLELIGREGDCSIKQTLAQKITASDGAEFKSFGGSVCVAGNVALIGAYETGNSGGSVYIFERDEFGVWIQKQKLTAEDEKYGFGGSVAISGNIVIVGAVGNTHDTAVPGAAYIFERDGSGTWIQKQKLTANDGDENDRFGCSTAVFGKVAIVGAWGKGECSGASYIFERDGSGTWVQKQKLTAGDGENDDYFGYSVAISGNTAIIGAKFDKGDCAGSAYVFEQNKSGIWIQKQKLIAGATARFGSSVSIAANIVLVGADHDSGKVDYSGTSYIFERDESGVWIQKQKLIASDGAKFDFFGQSVFISGNLLIIGACGSDINGIASAGAAYIFKRDGSSGVWYEIEKITAADGEKYDYFGNSVAISGNTAVIGSVGDDDLGASAGSAYIYSLD